MPAVTAGVKDALRLGCAAIGFTIYPGSASFKQMYEGLREIARRSRGTPRIANRLLRRGRGFAEVLGDGTITSEIADVALSRLDIDKSGFDRMDRKIIVTMIESFSGGPVGIESLAASIGEDKDTIEDIYEPYLIQTGHIKRTPRGRQVCAKAYTMLGLDFKKGQAELFDDEDESC